jgi:hypothetical protein
MARSWSTALRLAVGVLAAVAIVAMHGSSAEAHACDPAGHAMAAHGTQVTHGMDRVDAMHGHGHSHGHGHGHGEMPGHGPTHRASSDSGSTHEPAPSTGSAPAHCGPMACTALVAPSLAPPTVRISDRSVIHPDIRLPLLGTSAAPEPPVPRSSLRT